MAINDIVIIREIRTVQSFQKDAACNMTVAIQILSQICFIISGVQDRIIDAQCILIIKADPANNIRIFRFESV